MLFETEVSADNFIKYNSKEIYKKNGKAPVRSYFCPYCLGWHVTSNPNVEYFKTHKLKNEELIDAIVEANLKKAEEKKMAKTKKAEKKMRFFNMANKYFENGQYDCAVDSYLQAFYCLKNTEWLTAEKMLDSAFDAEILLLQSICNGSWKGFENTNYTIERFQKRLKKASKRFELRYQSKKTEIEKYLKEIGISETQRLEAETQRLKEEKQRLKAEKQRLKEENIIAKIDDYIKNGQYDCAVDSYLQAFYYFKDTESLTTEKMLDSAFDTEIILLQSICNGSWKGFENKSYTIKRFQKRLEKASIGLEFRYQNKKAEIEKYLKEIGISEKHELKEENLELRYLKRIEKVEKTIAKIDDYMKIGQNNEAIRLINKCANSIKNIFNNYSTVVEKDKLVKMVDQLMQLHQEIDKE